MNDTTRRFLDAVLERVPEARIVEVRLFPALRQGGIESGIAVLAVHPEPPLVLPDESVLGAIDESDSDLFPSDAQFRETPVDLVAMDDDSAEVDQPTVIPAKRASASVAPSSPVVPAKRASASAEPEPSVVSQKPHQSDERRAVLEVTLEGIASAPTQEIPAVDADEQPTREISIDLAAATSDTAPVEADEDIALGDILALPSPEQSIEGHDRLAILCARYKLIVKGPDRGKWDIEVVHQADAPLDSLDLVIKGVVRRSGDDAVPELFTRQSLRDLLDAPAWATDA